MKKMLTRIIALALVAVFITAPSTALAATATSAPVLTYSDDTIKIFEYQPSFYYLPGNQSTILQDTTTSDGWWYIPEGTEATLTCGFENKGSVNLMIIGEDGKIVYREDIVNEFQTSFNFPVLDKDTKYWVWVTGLSNVSLTAYFMIYR